MEFGVLYDFRNPPAWRRPTAQLYRETLDHIEACEALGFDTVWLTEHHFIDDEYLPSVLTMAAAVATRTSRVTIGTAVLLLPLHDPLRVAEDAAVVDQLCEGRLRLGLGLGYKLDELAAFRVPRRARPSMLEEGMAILRGAWADGPFSVAGRHWQLRDVDVTPKPHQRSGVPIWLAGRAPAPLQRAATKADGTIVAGGPEEFAQYLAARREAGREAPHNLCTFAFSYPAPDPERAGAELGRFADYRMENYVQWYGEAADLPRDAARLADAAAPARAWFRTPVEVVEEIRAMEALGVDALLWFATLPGAAPEATLPYFEVLAREVMPAFR